MNFEDETDFVTAVLRRLEGRWQNNRQNATPLYSCEEMLANFRDNGPDSELGVCRDMHVCAGRMLRAMNPAYARHAFGVSFSSAGEGYHNVLLAENPDNPNQTRLLNYSESTETFNATGANLLSQHTSIPDNGQVFLIFDIDGRMLRTIESNRLGAIRELSQNLNTRPTDRNNIFQFITAAGTTLENGTQVGLSAARLQDNDLLVAVYANREANAGTNTVASGENATLSYERTRGYASALTYFRREIPLPGLDLQTEYNTNNVMAYLRLENHHDFVLSAGRDDQHELRLRALSLEALVDGGVSHINDEDTRASGLADENRTSIIGAGTITSRAGLMYRYNGTHLNAGISGAVTFDHITGDVSANDNILVPRLQLVDVNANVNGEVGLNHGMALRASLALGLMYSSVGSYSTSNARLCLEGRNVGLCTEGGARVPLADCTALTNGGCNLMLTQNVQLSFDQGSRGVASIGAQTYQLRGMHGAEGRDDGIQLFFSTRPQD